VLHHEVDVVPFKCVVQGDSRYFFNSVRKSKRPFIPQLKTGGFLALFL